MVRILHLADLHLDTPFRGLTQTAPELGEQLRDATRQALDRAVEFALHEHAKGRLDAVTFGGDVFDQQSPSLRARRHFADSLARLCGEGIPCFIIAGNHDAIDDAALWPRQLSLPVGATLIGADWGVHRIEQAGRPVCAIVGRSYASTQDNRQPLEGFEALRAQTSQAPLTVGLLHCDVDGSRTEAYGYAPVSLNELRQSGCDAWMLGHIHNPSSDPLCDRPLVFYPGNPQGRDINEAGVKGATLVELELGQAPRTHFVPLSVILWERVRVPVDGCANDMTVTDAVRAALARRMADAEAELRGLIARVSLDGRAGTLELWRLLLKREKLDEIRENGCDMNSTPFILIESLTSEVERPLPPREELLQRQDFVGDFLRLVEAARNDPGGEAAQEVEETLRRLDENFDVRQFGGREALQLDWSALLAQAEDIGLSHLWDEGETSADEETDE